MQYFFIFPNLVSGKAVGITAGVMARKLGADAWISMTIGFAIGILVMLLMTYLCSKFEDKTIIQFSEELLGKWVALVIGIFLVLFFIMEYAVSANVMIIHMREYFLTQTPSICICIFYTLLCMYGVFLGAEVVVRFSFVGFIMVAVHTITMVTGTAGDLKPINLFPLMDKGLISDVLGSMYAFGDIAMAIFSVGILYPMLNKKEKIFRITFWSMLVGAVTTVIWPLYEIMVLSPDLMKQYVLVCMQQIRCAKLTYYFPRYELLMVSFFAFTLFVQSSVMFHCAKHCIKQVTGIKKDWIIILQLTLVLIILTYYMAKDQNNYVSFLAFPYSQICVALSIGLPIILFFAALFRGKLKR